MRFFVVAVKLFCSLCRVEVMMVFLVTVYVVSIVEYSVTLLSHLVISRCDNLNLLLSDKSTCNID